MNDAIDRFVKDPSLLAELCRDVIDQLEKAGVPVPDSLRGEKTRLAAALAVHTDAKQALAQLADEFQDILKDLRERLGQSTATPEPKPRGKRSKLPKTPQKILREHIIQALKHLGGRARVPDVIQQMRLQLEGKPFNRLAFRRALACLPQITLSLELQPMAGRGSQCFGKADVHVGGNGGMAIENAGEHGARNANVLGERRHAQIQVINPTLQQFARGGAGSCMSMVRPPWAADQSSAAVSGWPATSPIEPDCSARIPPTCSSATRCEAPCQRSWPRGH